MQLIHSNDELRQVIGRARSENKRIGFVPTMGALHQGHAALVQRSLAENDFTVVSIFVNPLQFGKDEDFDRYPRALGVDANLLTDLGVDILFAPGTQDIYPTGVELKSPSAGKIGEVFEGTSRPGHFDGMLKVVNRLLDLVSPDTVYFGAKDAQQVALVKAMLSDQISAGQRSPIHLVECETVRDQFGLALSSRNKFLSEPEIEIAKTLIAALRAGAQGVTRGEVLALAKAQLHPEAKLDYLELVDESFEVLDSTLGRKSRLIIAAKVGSTRLIDNILIDRTK